MHNVFLWAGGTPEDTGNMMVLTSTNIIYDVVRNVAGENIDVDCLMNPGIDPHSYDPTPKDIAKIETADIVFINGFGLEENLLSLITNAKTGKLVEVSRDLVPLTGRGQEEDVEHKDEYEEEHDDHHHDMDPHTWMSPLNVLSWIDVIEEELSLFDPDNSSEYQANADKYKSAVTALHNDIINKLSEVPESQRILVTDHNTLGYFARDYGFSVIGSILPGFTSNVEPSAKDITNLLHVINEYHVSVIFIGETAGSRIEKLSSTIQEAAGRSLDVRTILTGSLMPEGQNGDTYLSFMELCIGTIIDGIRGGSGV